MSFWNKFKVDAIPLPVELLKDLEKPEDVTDRIRMALESKPKEGVVLGPWNGGTTLSSMDWTTFGTISSIMLPNSVLQTGA